nr:hypothetical protein [Tanacetum cinerariifolium]
MSPGAAVGHIAVERAEGRASGVAHYVAPAAGVLPKVRCAVAQRLQVVAVSREVERCGPSKAVGAAHEVGRRDSQIDTPEVFFRNAPARRYAGEEADSVLLRESRRAVEASDGREQILASKLVVDAGKVAKQARVAVAAAVANQGVDGALVDYSQHREAMLFGKDVAVRGCILDEVARVVVRVAVQGSLRGGRVADAEALAESYITVGAYRKALKIIINDGTILLEKARAHGVARLLAAAGGRHRVVLNARRPKDGVEPVGALAERGRVGVLRNQS